MRQRVVQWGTGSVGAIALRELLSNPEFELAGVKVYSEAKVGLDAGELCGRPRTGVSAVRDPHRLPLRAGDCVLYCPMVADHDEIAGLLKRGVHVVTTASNVYPKFYGAEIYGRLERAALEGKAVFHGSGVNPAFMSEVLPLTLSGLVHRAKKITVREISDVNHYASTAPEIMLDHIGFGKPPDVAVRTGDFLAGMTAYFSESLLMICDHLGVDLERVEEHHELAASRVRVVLANGRAIEPGTVGCRRFEWRAIVGGIPRVVLSTFWKLTDQLEPRWEVGNSPFVEWTVTVEGTPSFQCRVATCASFDPADPQFGKGGEEAAVAATAIHAVNSIPFVCAAAPGVRTFLDLPIIASRGAFRGL